MSASRDAIMATTATLHEDTQRAFAALDPAQRRRTENALRALMGLPQLPRVEMRPQLRLVHDPSTRHSQ